MACVSCTLLALAVLGCYTSETSGMPPVITQTETAVETRRSSLRAPRLSGEGTNDPDNEIEVLNMDGWTDDEKLFMAQSDNAKHEPMDANGNRIIGGKHTVISKFPHQLQMNIDGKAMCGASIISEEWAITAAHCLVIEGRLYPANLISVRAGATIKNMGGRVHQVSSRIVHPGYRSRDNENKDNDIALLKVKKPFRISFLVQPIRMPDENYTVAEGNKAVVSGWGNTRYLGNGSNILQQVKVPIVNQTACVESYKDMNVITNRMVCAGQRAQDSCQGDSGGPLAYDRMLIGVVSFGHGCGLDNYPGVYARVSQFRSFIREKTGV